MNSLLQEPEKVDEPAEAKGYADVISRVAAEGHAVILRDALAMEEAQRTLKKLDLPRIAKENPPPQSWFDNDEPKPF